MLQTLLIICLASGIANENELYKAPTISPLPEGLSLPIREPNGSIRILPDLDAAISLQLQRCDHLSELCQFQINEIRGYNKRQIERAQELEKSICLTQRAKDRVDIGNCLPGGWSPWLYGVAGTGLIFFGGVVGFFAGRL